MNMHILFISPTPFYQDRGTPIAVDLFLRILLKQGHQIDLLTFHEGSDVLYTNLTIHRISPFISLTNIRPGFSFKKIVCDIFLFIKLLKLVYIKKYDVIHALEESAFMAMLIKLLRNIPFVYDMDSVLSKQLKEKFPFLRFFSRILSFFESLPIRSAIMVIPVCKEIEKHAYLLGAKNVICIKDIALTEKPLVKECSELEEYGLNKNIILYVGNLEYYQGIDLLLKSFTHLNKKNCSLVIIGGNEESIKHYKNLAASLSIADNVSFLGPKPVTELYTYLKKADILVSPRIAGDNTPLKIYSYLASGIPVLATNIISHSQILSDDIALMAEPEEQKFAKAMYDLLENHELRKRLTNNATEFIKRYHSFEHLEDNVNRAYGYIANKITVTKTKYFHPDMREVSKN